MSSTPPHGLAPILSTEDETPYSTPRFRPNSRRTSSFSSSSRSNSSDSSSESSSSFFFNNASPPHSPIITPLNLIRVPFSWEQTPGIPKNHKKTEPSGRRLLPLPPAGVTTSSAKKWRSQEEITAKKHVTRVKKDPFFAAMVECSKDDDDHHHHDHYDHGTNMWKGNLSDRFGFISMYTSCKKTCAISESIVYVPRAIPHYLHHRDRRGPVKP